MIGLVGQGLRRRAHFSFRRVTDASNGVLVLRYNFSESLSSKIIMSPRLRHASSEQGVVHTAEGGRRMEDGQFSTASPSVLEAKACNLPSSSHDSLSPLVAVNADAPSAVHQPVQAAAASNPLPPVEPGPEECCGNGCTTCVWTDYWTRLQAYEEAKRSR